MTDFVTRLESELRDAALRRERVGTLRGGALPRLRVAIRELPAAVAASTLLALALAIAAVVLSAPPQGPAHTNLPAALRGLWRAGAVELQLYRGGSERCGNLGLSTSAPCYTLGRAGNGVADEWGEVSVARDVLTFTSPQTGAPGRYVWTVDGSTLRLIKVRDPSAARSRALDAPLTHVQTRHVKAQLPIGWTARSFTSERLGYSVRYPQDWSAGSSANGQGDTLSPTDSELPIVSVVSTKLHPGTSAGHWSVLVNSRPEAGGCTPAWYRRLKVDGEAAMVTRYPNCHGTDQQWASFVHHGTGYRVLWRGKLGRDKPDGPLFDALLRTVAFLP
jgi:hypothetical protein